MRTSPRSFGFAQDDKLRRTHVFTLSIHVLSGVKSIGRTRIEYSKLRFPRCFSPHKLLCVTPRTFDLLFVFGHRAKRVDKLRRDESAFVLLGFSTQKRQRRVKNCGCQRRVRASRLVARRTERSRGQRSPFLCFLGLSNARGRTSSNSDALIEYSKRFANGRDTGSD